LDGVGATGGARYIAPSSHDGGRREFSSSEYSKTISGIVAGEPPVIALAAEKRLIDCIGALAAEGAVQSAHDISDGGLAVTLAESCFASVVAGLQSGSFPGGARSAHLGATINFTGDPAPAESVFFNERGARSVVSVTPSKLAAVLDTARQYSVAGRELGQVTRDGSFRIEHKGRTVIDSSVEIIRDAWAYSLERILTAK
jgi:phosphoribosylformylglycinamidine synthase